MNNEINIIPAARYEARFQNYWDETPVEFQTNDIVEAKNWMAEHLSVFPSPVLASIIGDDIHFFEGVRE